ncbi:hypothetical protein TWF679_005089 [Orbilia oligospora]|uniref:Uncharacterized protein n=1 Tax=Orbilia oligospora TaxID=2813651 RepID=A0A8H8UPH9_ORBOL|nr:hypothetical protein TWF679_005089 [Orbilia oligospora]
MARKSNQKTKATGLASTTKFGKLDYEIYCHFKRAFAKWGGTADHTTSIRRVVERQKGSDDDTSLLVKKYGVHDGLPGSLGSTGSQAENSSSSPPESVKLSGVEDSVHAPRGRTGMSKSKRENRQDQVLRPSASRITKSKTKTTAPLRPRLPPNVPAVGNWDMGLLEPTTADGRTAADSQQDKPENGVASTVEPNRLSGTEQRQTVEVAILIAKKTFFAHLCCQEGATGIEDPLQVTMSRYKAEMSETVPEMRFDAFLQAENLAANHGQIEPLVLAQILSECQRDLDILGGYQFHGIMEEVKAKALTGAMYWIIEQKRELEE